MLTNIYFQKNETAKEIFNQFQQDGYPVALICRDMPTEAREIEFKRFVYGDTKVLFATDAVSRSLDVTETRIVVHFDLPFAFNQIDPCFKLFLCRSTRAGRFGREGLVLTLIDSDETYTAYNRIAMYYKFNTQQLKH